MDINIQDLLIFFNSKASTSIAGFLIITVSIIAIYSQRKTARQKTSQLSYANDTSWPNSHGLLQIQL
jgi:hypothetical protein